MREVREVERLLKEEMKQLAATLPLTFGMGRFASLSMQAAINFQGRDWRRVKREVRKAALKEKASVAGIDRSAPKFWMVGDNG